MQPRIGLAPPGVRTSGRTRWWIVWTLFFSTVTNYISRQTFSVLAPMLAKQYHFSHSDLGQDSRRISDFLRDYVAAGRDLPRCRGHPARLGSGGELLVGGEHLHRVSPVLFSVLPHFDSCWGLEKASTGRAPARRWPSGFPARSAALLWLFSTAARAWAAPWPLWSFPGSPSPLAGAGLLCFPECWASFGWRCGCVSTTRWIVIPAVTPEEVALIRAGQEHDAHVSRGAALHDGLTLLKSSNVWAIVLGRALTDPIWWFYIFWLPQYLSDARGFSLKRIALFAWIPFVAADLGNFTGGFISGYCIRRGDSGDPRSHVGVRHQLPAHPRRYSRGSCTQRVLCLALICVALWGMPVGPPWG